MSRWQQTWKVYLVQFFCWLLVLQLINISIDPPNATTPTTASGEELKQNDYNQIESICELIAEEMADAGVPDHDGPEIEKDVNPVIFYCSPAPLSLFSFSPPLLQHQSYYRARCPLLFGEPLFQPPRFS